MTFTHPAWLAAGLFAAFVLLVLWRLYDARQHKALARFVAPTLRLQLTRSISIGKRRLQRGLFLVALLLLCVALAGPLVGYRWELISRRGNDIVFAVDTSRSMATPDIKPDRLTRAKLAIDDFTKQLDGDAVGIVAFAGTAFLVCPITLDYAAFIESLSAIDTNTIPRGGTNISSAIHEAELALRRRPNSDKILILVTDGEDLEGSALQAAQAAAQDDGLKIYTVGVGSAAGDLIPVPKEQGGGFVKDDTGAFVRSRLDETGLKAIAAATGGFYVPLGTQGEGLDTIFKSVLGSLAKHELASRQQKIYTERYQWPLAAALASLLLSLLIGTRRRGGGRQRTKAGITAALSGMLVCAAVPASRAATPVAGTPAAAATPAAEAAPKSPVADYNAGTAAYRASRYAQAAQDFQQSISHAPSSDERRLADQEDAYYNLGNTLYRTGQKTEQSAPQDTLKQWNEAVKAYETALQLRANDADSKFNRDFVKRKIAALQQQQNQQNKNNNQDKGQGKGQGQGQGQGQGKGQNPPENGKGQGQPPPGGQAPQSAGQQPAPQQQQPTPAQPSQQAQQPQPQPQQGQPQQPPPSQQSEADAARVADNQHQPGQMSREEARELLDSVKGDEHHAMGAPLAPRDPDDDKPEKPFKNW